METIKSDYKSGKIPVSELEYVNVEAKEWRDKKNGNSYWSSRVYFGTDKADYDFSMPYQYGYGRTAEYESLNKLGTLYVQFDEKDKGYWEERLWDMLDDKYKYTKKSALQREVKAWGNS